MTGDGESRLEELKKEYGPKHVKKTTLDEREDREFGKGAHRCTICGRYGAHIRVYGLDMCRQCFREKASDLGFKKYG